MAGGMPSSVTLLKNAFLNQDSFMSGSGLMQILL